MGLQDFIQKACSFTVVGPEGVSINNRTGLQFTIEAFIRAELLSLCSNITVTMTWSTESLVEIKYLMRN